MLGDGLGHASEQELFEPLSPVRAKDDAVGPPFRCSFQNAHARLAFDDAGMDLLESGGMKRLGGVGHELFRSAPALLQAGVLFKEGCRFDDVDQQYLASLGPQLRG